MPRATAEQIFRGLLRGPFASKTQSATNQWAGRTTLSSGSATVTVSTTNVDADSLIMGFTQGAANLASGTAIRHIECKSISPGNFFTLGTMDGIAIARDTAVMWLVIKAQ